ncbi:MAG: cohesin domain-containing protein, partial [Bacteroidetes bacterium]|nr:cohesin domain-containing protein [Bacteroidota bacterium]
MKYKTLKYLLAKFFISFVAVSAQSVNIGVADTNLFVGEEILLPVKTDSLLTDYDIYSFDFTLEYNSYYLLFQEVIAGNSLAGYADFSLTYNNSENNLIKIAGAGANKLAGTGTLFYIKMKAIRAGRPSIYFAANRPNIFNEGAPDIIFERGYINIQNLPTINVYPDNGLLSIGETLQFSVYGGTSPYTWRTLDSHKASIDESGLFTAQNIGTTRVVVEDNTGIIDTTTSVIEIRGLKLSIPDTSVFPGSQFN